MTPFLDCDFQAKKFLKEQDILSRYAFYDRQTLGDEDISVLSDLWENMSNSLKNRLKSR